jgi:hypothetical protein
LAKKELPKSEKYNIEIENEMNFQLPILEKRNTSIISIHDSNSGFVFFPKLASYTSIPRVGFSHRYSQTVHKV